jgi:hypothetical protein
MQKPPLGSKQARLRRVTGLISTDNSPSPQARELPLTQTRITPGVFITCWKGDDLEDAPEVGPSHIRLAKQICVELP